MNMTSETKTPQQESTAQRGQGDGSTGPQPSNTTAPAPKQRLQSLDAYRGLIMITLAFAGFGMAKTAANHLEANPSSHVWQTVKHQFSHVEWQGYGYWDMIQPSFMFMVGVSMAFSYAKRKRLGHGYGRMLGHAMWRSLILILLGIFLISNWSDSTNWSLMNVLTQIGLGYTLLFLLWGRKLIVQAIAAALILIGTWIAFTAYSGSGYDPALADKIGVSQDWAAENLEDVDAAWHKNANIGHAIDLHVLNWLPQQEPFSFNRGGYQTFNFIPSLATMLFGLMCGELLRGGQADRWKLLILLLAGIGGVLAGLVLQWTGVCPLVKRIWTPSWALFSTGICCLILGTLYAVIDVLRFRRWSYPLVVVGMNSIAIYCMSQLLKPWTAKTLQTHLGQGVFEFTFTFGNTTWHLAPASWQPTLALYAPTIQAVLVGMMFWLACWWMYRQKIFIRI